MEIRYLKIDPETRNPGICLWFLSSTCGQFLSFDDVSSDPRYTWGVEAFSLGGKQHEVERRFHASPASTRYDVEPSQFSKVNPSADGDERRNRLSHGSQLHE